MNKIFNILSVLVAVVTFSTVAGAQVTKDVLDQNADQSQGNYAATNLSYLGSGSLGMTQSAWKDPLQHMGEGQSRPGYTKYYWTPELVLPVRLREGMYTLINFPNWEIVEQVYLGDSQSFNAEPYGPSSLMVYPEASQFLGVDTNMIVFGRSGNKYVFYVQSEAFNTDRITNAIIDIEVLKQKNPKNRTYATGPEGVGGNIFEGGDTSVVSSYTRNLQKEDWIENIPVDPTKFRFDIEVYVPNPDDIIIAPERVWRDNIFTYIDLGEKALTAVQRPIVTLIVERSETPVGFRSAGPNNRLIIVEGMGDMVLRSGKRIVCLKLRRSDADGLENTIYADTNEWDLQTAHASQGGDTVSDIPQLSDMQQSENIKNKNTIKQNMIPDVYNDKSSSNEDEDFFSDSMFFDNSFEQNNGVSGSSKGQGVSKNISNIEDIEKTLNSMPKVSPIVSSNNEKAVQNEKLTGQYDVKVGESEFIFPEYNNTEKNIDVSVEKQNNPLLELDNVSSQNNSNPIFIQGSSSSSKQLVSPETEALLKEFKSGRFYDESKDSNISIELGTDENVNNLEKLWNDVSRKHSATLVGYQPFYSVDTPADGQGKEVFHLRVGPIKSIDDGDNICSQLGRNGIFCSVVRIQ